jgi:hypothetical protein
MSGARETAFNLEIAKFGGDQKVIFAHLTA